MYHDRNNLYFGRHGNGDVRVIKFLQPPSAPPTVTGNYGAEVVVFDIVVTAAAWASIVASVSLQGYERGRFYSAQAFHMNPTVLPSTDNMVACQNAKLCVSPLHCRSYLKCLRQPNCFDNHCPVPHSCTASGKCAKL